MATSGTVDTSAEKKRNSYYYLTWSVVSQDIAANKTRIEWKAYLHNEWEWYTNALGFNSITINGTQVLGQKRYSNYTTSGNFLLESGTLDITHNTDGTKSFTISLVGWFIDWGTSSGSGTFSLDKINRGIMNYGDGSWKPCFVYYGDGEWKQCLIYYGDGEWKLIGGT